MANVGRFEVLFSQTFICFDGEDVSFRLDRAEIEVLITRKKSEESRTPSTLLEFDGKCLKATLVNHDNPLGSMTTKDHAMLSIDGRDVVLRVATYAVETTRLISVQIGLAK